MTERLVYSLVIEWDGDKPPTTWYNRLAKLGLFVRGSKEKSPLDRRLSRSGIISQEGTLLLNNQGQAIVLGALARKLGAKAVLVGQLAVQDESSLSIQDQAALDRIAAVYGKRGRPDPARDFVITCLDEHKSSDWNGTNPVTCPICGSFNITFRLGKRQSFDVDAALAKHSLVTVWQRSRFQAQVFETPINTITGDPLDMSALPLDASEIHKADLAVSWGDQVRLRDLVAKGKILDSQALRLLDCAYAALGCDAKTRLQHRLDAIAAYAMSGKNFTGRLAADPTNLDWFDLWFYEKPLVTRLWNGGSI